MILVGDIGGTNARLALTAAGSSEPAVELRYTCAAHADFAPLLGDFLAATGATISAGCLAVAGPVSDDGRRARLTNLPWTIDADALTARFGLGHLSLVNDFAAAALGVTVSPPEHLVALQAGEPLPTAPRLVVGAGTGLGMAALLPHGDGFRVLPGEGGHIAFGPTDTLQAELWAHLHAGHGRVTAERVISGPGLQAIHDFLCRRQGIAPALADPAEIAAAADEPASLARSAVDLFLAAYGAFAGDMAMALMARGGVYLAGGIAAKLLPLIPTSPFMTAFNAKAEHTAIARRMPVFVASDPALGLRGAAVFAMAST